MLGEATGDLWSSSFFCGNTDSCRTKHCQESAFKSEADVKRANKQFWIRTVDYWVLIPGWHSRSEFWALPSWAGGEKNSTSVARLAKKSFKKNSASFNQTKKQVCHLKTCYWRHMRYLWYSGKNIFYLINIEAKRHQRNTQTALLWSLAWLRTHVQCLNCQLKPRADEAL